MYLYVVIPCLYIVKNDDTYVLLEFVKSPPKEPSELFCGVLMFKFEFFEKDN